GAHEEGGGGRAATRGDGCGRNEGIKPGNRRGVAMAKDRLGNDLETGQLVEVKLDSPSVLGKIVKISEGGLSLASGAPGAPAQMTPGIIEVYVTVQIPVHPQNPQAPNVLRVVDPEQNKPKLLH